MRNLIQTGDILLCRGKKPLSKAIMVCTKSQFSHAATAIWINDKLFIIDAQRDGVNIRPYEAWLEKYKYDILIFRNPKLDDDLFQDRALSKIGITAYDFEGTFIRQPIELLTGIWKKRKDEDRRMYCSEYVAWTNRIPEFYSMSPEDLYQYCLINKFKEVTRNFYYEIR